MKVSSAYCERCGAIVPCEIHDAIKETVLVRGKSVLAQQMHAYCSQCGEEVTPNEIIDFNVFHAHDAYRKGIGSITAEEIRSLLDRYDIGAQPMSQLLGWGENTIERQMKHTVPDREHARRLRELSEPSKMLELLRQNGSKISPVAYDKAMKAAQELLRAKSNSGQHYTLRLNDWLISEYAGIVMAGGI